MKLSKTNTQKIIELHEQVMGYVKSTFATVIELGKLLAIQKKALPHGKFQKYVERELPFSTRTARNYMRIYDNRKLLKAENVSDLTEAYEFLRTPQLEAENRPGQLSREEAEEIDEAIKATLKALREEPREVEKIPSNELLELYKRMARETVVSDAIDNYKFFHCVLATVINYRHGEKYLEKVFNRDELRSVYKTLQMGKKMSRYVIPRSAYILRGWGEAGYYLARDYLRTMPEDLPILKLPGVKESLLNYMTTDPLEEASIVSATFMNERVAKELNINLEEAV